MNMDIFTFNGIFGLFLKHSVREIFMVDIKFFKIDIIFSYFLLRIQKDIHMIWFSTREH